MDKITSFKDLFAWQKGHHFPKDETFSLAMQMKRAAVSITSNIAEGFGQDTYRHKIQFYNIALGSLIELQNQLIITKDVGYIDLEIFVYLDQLTTEVHKILAGLIKKSRSNL